MLDINALLFLCGHCKINHGVKLYFNAHTLKTSSCCILKILSDISAPWKFTLEFSWKPGSHQLFPGAVRGSSWCLCATAESSFLCQWQMSRIQSDCKTAATSWAIQGNFWQACQPTEALILLLIESCILETPVPSFLLFQSSGEAFPPISVRIQHHVITKLFVTYWLSLYCLVHYFFGK